MTVDTNPLSCGLVWLWWRLDPSAVVVVQRLTCTRARSPLSTLGVQTLHSHVLIAAQQLQLARYYDNGSAAILHRNIWQCHNNAPTFSVSSGTLTRSHGSPSRRIHSTRGMSSTHGKSGQMSQCIKDTYMAFHPLASMFTTLKLLHLIALSHPSRSQ